MTMPLRMLGGSIYRPGPQDLRTQAALGLVQVYTKHSLSIGSQILDHILAGKRSLRLPVSCVLI